jgi:hypothetical protein
MGQASFTDWYGPALAAIRRDPRKAGVLVVLVSVLGVMWIRTLSSRTPRPAAAAAATVANRGSGNTAAGTARTRGAVANPRLQQWAQGPVAPISRNLFTVRLEYFPAEGPRSGAGVKESMDDGFWGRLEKSLTLQADQRDKRENQIANYKAQAAQLNLQSTMMSPLPKALLNGELVGEGDVVASFRVLKIEARRVIVEREGIRLEIKMK